MQCAFSNIGMNIGAQNWVCIRILSFYWNSALHEFFQETYSRRVCLTQSPLCTMHNCSKRHVLDLNQLSREYLCIAHSLSKYTSRNTITWPHASKILLIITNYDCIQLKSDISCYGIITPFHSVEYYGSYIQNGDMFTKFQTCNYWELGDAIVSVEPARVCAQI